MYPQQAFLDAVRDTIQARTDDMYWSNLHFLSVLVGTLILLTLITETIKYVVQRRTIGKMTQIVEQAKLEYTEAIESLKDELSLKNHFSRVRYERELKVYEAIWPTIWTLSDRVKKSYSGAFELKDKPEELRAYYKRNFHDHAASLQEQTEKNRPFFPDEILRKVVRLENLCTAEADGSILLQAPRNMVDVKDSHLQIEKAIEDVATAIRERLARFDG